MLDNWFPIGSFFNGRWELGIGQGKEQYDIAGAKWRRQKAEGGYKVASTEADCDVSRKLEILVEGSGLWRSNDAGSLYAWNTTNSSLTLQFTWFNKIKF